MTRTGRACHHRVGSPHKPTSAGVPVRTGDARDGNPSPLTDRDLHANRSPLSAERRRANLGAPPSPYRRGRHRGRRVRIRPPLRVPGTSGYLQDHRHRGQCHGQRARAGAGRSGSRTAAQGGQRYQRGRLRSGSEHRSGERGVAHSAPGRRRGRLRPGSGRGADRERQPGSAVAEHAGGQRAFRPADHDGPGGPGELRSRDAPGPVLGPVHGGRLRPEPGRVGCRRAHRCRLAQRPGPAAPPGRLGTWCSPDLRTRQDGSQPCRCPNGPP